MIKQHYAWLALKWMATLEYKLTVSLFCVCVHTCARMCVSTHALW
jgi:hypothetical protein